MDFEFLEIRTREATPGVIEGRGAAGQKKCDKRKARG
jgi:hypothetical protein